MKRGAIAVAILCAAASLPARGAIRYRISVAQAGQHCFHVTMTIPGARNNIRVELPAWNALYQIRDFAYRVEDLHALDVAADGEGGIPLRVRKLTKDTWQISDFGKTAAGIIPGEVQVEYRIFWNEPGPFDSQLDAAHAFTNFAEVLCFIPDRREENVSVEFTDVPAGWKAYAELPQQGPFQFSAGSYDALVDAPAELGEPVVELFDETGARYRLVLDGAADSEQPLLDGLHRIVRYETSLMRGAPFREYTFFIDIGPYAKVGGGGMEHSNCTAISASSVTSTLNVAAHEFFHLWNVKRIRPQSLQPVDYSKEQWTRALWFAEGVTSTYGNYTLERSGLWTREQFLNDLGAQITGLQSRPARLWQSVEESSLDAWLEKYDFYSRPDRSISYYNKGQILGDLLDLKIREATGNHVSLDDVLRRMYAEYAEQGKYYDDSAGIRKTAQEVCGCDLKEFFEDYVAGTKEIPYGKFLAFAGLALQKSQELIADPGFTTERQAAMRMVVTGVSPGSAAATAGLQAGDTLLTINGEPASPYFSYWIKNRVKPGDMLRLLIRRAGQERHLQFVAGSAAEDIYQVAETPDASARALRIREGWLEGKTE